MYEISVRLIPIIMIADLANFNLYFFQVLLYFASVL